MSESANCLSDALYSIRSCLLRRPVYAIMGRIIQYIVPSGNDPPFIM